MKPKVLLIDDEMAFFHAVQLFMRGYPIEIVWAATGAEGIRIFRANPYGFASVIADYGLPDLTGSEVVETIRKINPSQDILFATGSRDADKLIDFLETGGARSFLYKGRTNDQMRSRILDSVANYLNRNRVIGVDEYTPTKAEIDLKAEGFVGRDAATFALLERIRLCRAQPYSTLIVGETGTGKELVARALVPKGKNVIVVDCPRYSASENLLESDLFGHVKGAFTDAKQDKAGLMAHANGQVVLFDEFHKLSLSAQAKLLRFLQEMKYRRLGDDSGREVSVNFKLIAAAKPEIFEQVRTGSFLEDLLHRVGRLEIHVPPLRERRSDIELLVRQAQDQFNTGKASSARRQFRLATISEMESHPWTGNVRELQNAAFQLLTMAQNDIVEPADFKNYLSQPGRRISDVAADELSLPVAREKIESESVKKALMSSTTQTEAARKLGMSRWSLIRLLEKLGINPTSYLLTN